MFMQSKRQQTTHELTLLPPLESLIPEDHYLKRLDKVLDLSFIHESVRDRYCQDNGRPSIDPEVIIRLFLIQALDGIVHVRELMRQVQVNLAYRWFIGYRLDEKLPDHSTLSRALDRFGDMVFNELFHRSISQCKRSGLIEGKVLHIDATTIRADLDCNKVGKPDSPDPDACFGHFPGGKLTPGYKQHTIADEHSRVILGMSVTAANVCEHDRMMEVLDEAVGHTKALPDVVCADAGYSSGENNAEMEERGIRFVSPPPKARTYTGDKYFTVEDFKYDEKRDIFICPAGKTLKYMGRVKDRPKQRRYGVLPSVCCQCKLKDQCTKANRRQLKVSKNHAALVRLRTDSKTESFKKLYRNRAPVIEGVFAEAKEWHGLRRAWRRGISKMRIQCLLIAAVINLKRLATCFLPCNLLFTLYSTIINENADIWARLQKFNRNTARRSTMFLLIHNC
jgi:transposase